MGMVYEVAMESPLAARPSAQVGGGKYGNDRYKELCVHGPVSFAKNIAMLHLDPSHKKDDKMMAAVKLWSEKFGIPYVFQDEVKVHWTPRNKSDAPSQAAASLPDTTLRGLNFILVN